MKRNVFFIAFCAFVSIFFIACGGEDGPDPVDDNTGVTDDATQSDDVEPVDNEIPDDVQSDNIQTDDDQILTDETPDQDQGTPDPTICSTFEPDNGTWYSNEEGDLIYETERAIDENGDSYCIIYTTFLGGEPLPWYSYDNTYPLTLIASEEEYTELQREGNQLIIQDYYKGNPATKMVWSR